MRRQGQQEQQEGRRRLLQVRRSVPALARAWCEDPP